LVEYYQFIRYIKIRGIMKNLLTKFSASFLLITVSLIILPQQISAQVSSDTERPAWVPLLRAARIQVFDQRMETRDFTLPLLNGEDASLSSYKGKVVILNFWATWCPPCRAEMPSMETLYQRFKNQGLEILAVDLGESPRTVRQFIQTHRYTFPVMLDTNSRIGSLYGIQSIPTSLIIDREGKIIGRVVGAIHWDTPQAIAAFEALLNNR